MLILRIFLVIHLAVLTGYTLVVIQSHGMNLLPVFFGDMAAMAWPGQFNLDFMGFLILSALWTAWRNGFSAIGIILAAVAFFGGMAFLSIYLLILSLGTDSIRDILLGINTR